MSWTNSLFQLVTDTTVLSLFISIIVIGIALIGLAIAIIIFRDLRQLKKNESELTFRATHDVLTELPNRALLFDRINQYIAAAKREQLKVAILFIDLDNFQYINDMLGHPVGDILLQEVALRLRSGLRAIDTLARIGGDEFVIALPNQTDIYNLPRLMDRVIELLGKPYLIENQELHVTCSIGISIYPEHGATAEILLKNADVAMYQAKAAGRNTFRYFTETMHTQITNRLNMENDLSKALERNELFLEYQPQIGLKNNKLLGFEALLRWQHPSKGVIYPNDFIGIAEETGLISPIGQWVLENACLQNKVWQDMGLPTFCVSVNLSAKQFKDKNLIETISDILFQNQLESQYLELELTESVAMSNPPEFIKMLKKCRNLGIKTAIDDFGTGYSSLNYLRQFPVNCLKIDKSFIEELGKEENDLSIIKAIIYMGHSLKLSLLAEGIETKQQLELLKINGCDGVQGNAISPPIPALEVPNFIRRFEAEMATINRVC